MRGIFYSVNFLIYLSDFYPLKNFFFSVKPNGDVSFVAFTVCPAYENAYNNDKLTFYGSSRNEYRGGNFTTANPMHQSAFEIFENVTYSLKEILEDVSISTADSNDSKGKKF